MHCNIAWEVIPVHSAVIITTGTEKYFFSPLNKTCMFYTRNVNSYMNEHAIVTKEVFPVNVQSYVLYHVNIDAGVRGGGTYQ